MKKVVTFLCGFLFVASVAFAEGSKTYQVTGPILDVNANTIVVDIGKESWEINRDAATKVVGVLKIGSRVTIEYTMRAVSVEVKDAKNVETKKAEPKQITGPILDVNANTIVVDIGKESWEINRDAATKVTGDLKVGSSRMLKN
jgi:hypothetical protein